jgi:4-hydroxy-2-oxoheptanedioate aldolase
MNPGSMNETVAIGSWLHIASGFGAEIMSAGGFDWSCIDRQHGLIDDGDMFDMIRAISGMGIEPVVRVSSANAGEIGRALDAGATTIIVPNIVSVDEAVIAVEACSFMPEGRRSFSTTRSKLFSSRATVRCMVMIETASALDQLPQIAGVRGLAGLFVGPADLNLALLSDEEAVKTAIRRVADICAENNLVAGAFVGSEDVARWVALGYSFLALNSDSNLLLAAATELVSRARAQIAAAHLELTQ